MNPHYIAMWSGPRNISTAMMRSWENRPDTVVIDEPFYGYYLDKTGIPHPGAEEIIADQGTDWKAIIEQCTGSVPGNAPIFYQKHMTMHLLPEMDRSWLGKVTNCFLIRNPAEVIASYSAVREDATLFDIGAVQQAELFDHVIKVTGELPMVIDSKDFLKNPHAMLERICAKLGIPFLLSMLTWPEGKRDSDGIWSKYWYDSVWKSTGFTDYVAKPIQLNTKDQAIADEAMVYYEMLYQYREQIESSIM